MTKIFSNKCMRYDNFSFKPSCITRAELGMEAWKNRYMAWSWIGMADY